MKLKLKNLIIVILFYILPILILFLGFQYLIFCKNKNIHIENIVLKKLDGQTIERKENHLILLKEKLSLYNTTIDKYQEKIIEIENDTSLLIKNNNSIEKTIALKEVELKNKKQQNTELNKKYKALYSYYIKGVITMNQYPKYPNGCEGVALYILLKYYNVNVSASKIMEDMPKSKTPYSKNGIMYGGDPNYYFLGDPRSYSGWGIWDKGLANLANKYKKGIINGTGMEFNKIIELVKQNRPVIVWTSINLLNPHVAMTWKVEKTNKKITWKNYNHAVVVIGYDDKNIIISDPINGKIRYMNKQSFIYIYNYMGKRAIYY